MNDHLLSFRCARPAAAMLAACIGLSGATIPAAAAPPTQEKCTCDLKPETVLNNGAAVRNAGACWRAYEDRTNEWCDIAIHSLENSQEKREFVVALISARNDGSSLTELLMSSFQVLVESWERTEDKSGFSGSPAQDQDALYGQIKMSEAILSKCLVNFAEDVPLRIEPGDSRAGCGVGEASGWLRIEFVVEGVNYAFLVAPNA